MARTTVKCFFSVAWTTLVATAIVGGVAVVALGTALDRTEMWINSRLR